MKLIKILFKFLDKHFIIPITKFFVFIGEKLKITDKPLEKAISKKSSLIVLSLAFAIVVFLVVDNKNVKLLETNAEVINNRPLTAIYNDEQYVVEGLPKTVDITLIGTKANLYLAKQLPTKDITVDLSNLKPGKHEVKLKYKQSLSSVEYKIDPSVVTVDISIKQSETRELKSEIVNLNKLDSKYSIKEVSLYQLTKDTTKKNAKEEKKEVDEVIIKGTNEQIAKVSNIRALVNINNMVDPHVGDNDIDNVDLVAYDETGNIVDIEIVPSKIRANVVIEAPSKIVPLDIETEGKVIFGKAIKSINASVQKVTIYGDSKTLENTTSIKAKVDVTDLKTNKDYTVTIKKPSGIRDISEKTVNVRIELDDEATTELSGVRLSYINLNPNYTVQATTENSTEISVVLKGVSSVISNVEATSVEAYVDLDGLGVGEHDVKIMVKGDDPRVLYTPKLTKTKIKIANK